MNKIKKLKYDLIFSIGQNCLVTEILRENELINFSTPFDWVQIYGYDTAINILKNKFQNYFCKEDLEFCGVDLYDGSDIFYNKKTKIVFVHNFGINAAKNFARAYNKLNLKLQKRTSRILNKISNNEKICLLYVEYVGLSDKNIKISNKIILKDIEELEKIYNKKFDIFYVKHNPDLKLNEYVLDNKICEINNSILEGGRKEYQGNKPMVNYVVSQRIGLRHRKIFMRIAIKTHKIIGFFKKLIIIINFQYT